MSFLTDVIRADYKLVRVLKNTERSKVIVYKNPQLDRRIVWREAAVNIEVFRLLMGISYPGLPEVYAITEHEGKNVILEQYIDGITLEQELQRGTISEKRTRRIAAELCNTLTLIHKMGIIHRDIKPSNIMLLEDDFPVLLDFDVARIYKPDSTGDTTVLGTRGFAAPEQLDIAQTDGRSDIYSLGIMMNYMLTGEHPTNRRHKGLLSPVIDKCTHLDPNRRYQTAEQLRRWL